MHTEYLEQVHFFLFSFPYLPSPAFFKHLVRFIMLCPVFSLSNSQNFTCAFILVFLLKYHFFRMIKFMYNTLHFLVVSFTIVRCGCSLSLVFFLLLFYHFYIYLHVYKLCHLPPHPHFQAEAIPPSFPILLKRKAQAIIRKAWFLPV
jgi:hypothetical protein